MKKIFTILLILIASFSNAQCPDSVFIRGNEIAFVFTGGVPHITINTIEMDTFNGINNVTVTLTANRIADTLFTNLPTGVNENTVYEELRYYFLSPSGSSYNPRGSCTTSRALPVDLMYLKAEQKDNLNIVTWATAMEYNCLKFKLYRDTELVYECGCTNSNVITEYTFTELAQNGIYELFQTDYDGTTYNEGFVGIFSFKYEKEDEVILLMEFSLGNLYLINGVKTFIYHN
jgi:hypothetical protein